MGFAIDSAVCINMLNKIGNWQELLKTRRKREGERENLRKERERERELGKGNNEMSGSCVLRQLIH